VDDARSRWLAFTLFPLGWLTWAAFLHIGRRARRRDWVALAAVYGAFALAGTLLLLAGQMRSGGILALLAWGGGIAHALALRRPYLDCIAVSEDPELLAAEAHVRRRAFALSLAAADPARARELGVGRPDLEGAFHAGLVDLNGAPAHALATLPGIDGGLAERIVATRDELGAFTSLEELGALLDLEAPLVEGLRERTVVLRRS
jgi:hypothetical protein